MLLRVLAVVGNFSLLTFSELRAQWTLQESAFAIMTPNSQASADQRPG